MIQVSYPWISDLEKKYVNDALSKGDIGIGEYIGRFEESWAKYNKKAYGVSCNSGTNAIYLALRALGIGMGDIVIIPEYTMIATAWAVTYTGATPVFVDCLDDLTIDWVKLREMPLKNVKAIIPVPVYGREVSDEVYWFARTNDIFIIEDMAEAHGMTPKGDIACYSFYGNKILTTGEGGMCLTDNKEWADEMRSLANMYFDKGRTMIHPKVGHNFRMTNIQAAIGCAQVERITEILSRRHMVCKWYNEFLPDKYKMPVRQSPWVYDIKVDDNVAMKELLLSKGIDSRYGFKPMSQQPMYKGDYQLLNAYRWSKNILYLPLYPTMTKDIVKNICQHLK